MERTRIRSIKWWQFHHALWRYRLFVAAVVVLGTAAAVIYTSRIPKRYRSTASALVDNFGQINNEYYSSSSSDFSRAHKVLAESRIVREMAVSRAKLDPSQLMDTGYEARVDGVMIYLSVIDGDRSVAAKMANAWCESFIDELSTRSRSVSESVQKSFTDQLAEDAKKLNEANEKQKNFFAKTKYDPAVFATDPIHAEVSRLEMKKADAEDQLRTLDMELKAFDDPANTAAMISQFEHVKSDVAFGERWNKVREMETKLAELQALYSDPNQPSIKQAAESLKQMKALLDETRKSLRGSLILKKEMLLSDVKSRTEQYSQKKSELDQKQAGSIEHKGLSAEIEKHKRSVDQLNERLREISMQLRNGHSNVIKWEPAEISQEPFMPSWRQNVSTGLLMSLLLACALVFGLEQIDDSVRTPRDLELRFNAMVLGAVPSCGRKSMGREGYFLAKQQGSSIAVDSLRGIHIGLEVRRKSAHNSGAFVINVTSAVPQDGKSFITSNLGILFASLGRKVLVVDADLRKASISRAFELENLKGFSEIVKTQQWEPKYAVFCPSTGYDLLPAGSVDGSGSQSFNPEIVRKLIERMKRDYDVILFDTPPVLALPDSCVLGALTEVTLLVTRSRHTRLAQAERAANILYSAKTTELLFVVNGLDSVDAAAENYGTGYGYAYSYGDGYGKGYGYGHDSRTRQENQRSKNPTVRKPLIEDKVEVEEEEEEEEIVV